MRGDGVEQTSTRAAEEEREDGGFNSPSFNEDAPKRVGRQTFDIERVLATCRRAGLPAVVIPAPLARDTDSVTRVFGDHDHRHHDHHQHHDHDHHRRPAHSRPRVMALASSQGSARRHSEHRNAASPTTHLRREIVDAMALADVDWLVDNEMLPSIVRDVVHDAQSELVEEWTAIERGHGKAAKFSTSAEVKQHSASKLASYLPQSPAWRPAHHLLSWATPARRLV
jgi:hypothetical protein